MKNLRGWLKKMLKCDWDRGESDRFPKIWMVLSIFGFFTIKDGWKFNGRSLIFVMFMIAFYINDLINFSKKTIDGFLRIPQDVEILTFMQTQGITLYRMYLLIRHRKSLKRLVNYANVEFPSWISCPKMKRVVEKSFDKGSWIFFLHAFQLVSVGSMLYIRPLLSAEPNALVMQYPLGRFPMLPTNRFPFYQITYLLQVVYMSIAISLAFSINMIFFSLSVKLCAYLEYLPMEIEKTERGATISNNLQVFVDRYNTAKEFVDLLNEYFSKILFIQPIYAGFSIITSSLVFDGTQETLSFLGIALAHTLELYIYCYAGDLTTEKSFELADKIYSSHWYNFSEVDKKKILQILQQYNRPFMIKAGLFGVLNRYTFTNTMKTTYSIWTVLNQIK